MWLCPHGFQKGISKSATIEAGEIAMLTLHLQRLLRLGIMAALLSGCGIFKKPEPTITPLIPSTVLAVPVEADDFKYMDCPFEIPEDMPEEYVYDIQCATLSVPEDRLQLDSPKIQLAVAVVKTPSSSPKPDPVLVLVGNPGYGLNLAYALPYLFQSISAERDMIVIDQRGTGYSEPSISCPQLANLNLNANLELSLQEANDRLYEASQSCYAAITGSTENLPFYTTSAVAADLEDLRQVLGISQWNIYTLFTGSRVALTMMRDYPQGIRSAVLDSAIPLQINPAADWGTNALMVFDKLFQRCADDTECVKAYPNLKDNFYTLLDQLDAEPIQVDAADLNSGNRYKVTLNSERLGKPCVKYRE
jgi:pimeloyl-ACP methyl ester carboxylesterase